MSEAGKTTSSYLKSRLALLSLGDFTTSGINVPTSAKFVFLVSFLNTPYLLVLDLFHQKNHGRL